MTSLKDKNRVQRFVEKAYRAFFTPGQFEIKPEAQDMLSRGETYQLPWSGGEIAVTAWGADGPAALLVHGWGGARAQMTGFVGPLLGAGYRVVAFDQPAHGESGSGMTNILEITASMESLAAREGPFQTVLAHSFGTLAVSYAIIHRKFPRPERLVYFGAFNRLLDTIPRFQALSGLSDPIISGIRARIDAEFGEGVLEPIVNADLVWELDIPALLFHDTDDPVTPVGDSRAIAAAWPSARYVETKGLGHHGALGSEDVLERVMAFLAGDMGST